MVLWRDPWLKPLSDFDIGYEDCATCGKPFKALDFVTGCEFCQIGPMHDVCADSHIALQHAADLEAKVSAHKDKPLHGFQ